MKLEEIEHWRKTVTAIYLSCDESCVVKNNVYSYIHVVLAYSYNRVQSPVDTKTGNIVECTFFLN